MELVVTKRRGKWRRKRHSKKRLRERTKCEVRSAKQRIVFPKYVTDARETLATGTMQADAFWKNYAVAQEWQKRHSITWWRSRCVALEHENRLLRDKVRLLAQHRGYRDTRQDDYHAENNGDHDDDDDDDDDDNDDDDDDDDDDNVRENENPLELGTDSENLEFTVTEDMLNFFETSERHKREMRRKRESGTTREENSEETPFVSTAEKARVRREEAALLYGDAGSKILALETVLQSTVERYEDTANPQYWPNIPLKL